jgi:hypothetical protein
MASDLKERLRGIYRIPIKDGLGAVGGGEEPDNPNEFVRRFPTTPIQEEAAARITELEDALRVLLVENEGRYATKEAWDRARKVLGSTGGQHQ